MFCPHFERRALNIGLNVLRLADYLGLILVLGGREVSVVVDLAVVIRAGMGVVEVKLALF